MEELLAWLKDTRLLLASHLPDDFDALQGELRKCEVRSACLLFSLYTTHILHTKTKNSMYSRTCLFPEFHCYIPNMNNR